VTDQRATADHQDNGFQIVPEIRRAVRDASRAQIAPGGRPIGQQRAEGLLHLLPIVGISGRQSAAGNQRATDVVHGDNEPHGGLAVALPSPIFARAIRVRWPRGRLELAGDYGKPVTPVSSRHGTRTDQQPRQAGVVQRDHRRALRRSGATFAGGFA